jgi:imidazole glycerol phosphate synthase subunit HisF
MDKQKYVFPLILRLFFDNFIVSNDSAKFIKINILLSIIKDERSPCEITKITTKEQTNVLFLLDIAKSHNKDPAVIRILNKIAKDCSIK